MRPAAAVLALALALAGCGQGRDPAPAERGRALARQKGCAGCHSTDGSKSVGPTWGGLFGSTVELADGTTVTADESYLRESMLAPSARTVKGYPQGLMERTIKPGSLSEEEVGALIAYIRTLR